MSTCRQQALSSATLYELFGQFDTGTNKYDQKHAVLVFSWRSELVVSGMIIGCENGILDTGTVEIVIFFKEGESFV